MVLLESLDVFSLGGVEELDPLVTFTIPLTELVESEELSSIHAFVKEMYMSLPSLPLSFSFGGSGFGKLMVSLT